ncbi:MAG: CPBP family intramembrane metalloprotease [Bacteroidaceae bacterium]|nr:CPBP family intramembrane metalloprotease [Bacteroidaceae bacterium]
MKRAILSLALFFAVQMLAALAAAAYMLACGKEILADTDAFAIAVGNALLFGNIFLVAILAVRPLRRVGTHTITNRFLFDRRNIILSALAILILALGETMFLAPLGLDDSDTERLFAAMTTSPLCLINIIVAGPVAEEFVFRRGMLGGLLARGIKPWVAVFASALCFAAVHGNLTQAPPAFISGMLLGIVYIRSRSLMPCVVAHIANNTGALLSLAYPAMEDTLVSQHPAVLLGGGLLLAGIAFALVFRMKPYADRNN